MLSISSANCPMSNKQPAPRSTFQAGHAKQALGYYHINYHLRFDKGFKQLYKATRSFTETDTYFVPSMDLFPCGQTANIAFFVDPDNQEDSLVVSEDYLNAINLKLYQVYNDQISSTIF